MQLSGYTQTPLHLRGWALALAMALGLGVFVWGLTGTFVFDLAHVVLYSTIILSVVVLGIVRIELNSGLNTYQVSVIVPLLAFVGLEQNLMAGYVAWVVGLIGSCLTIASRRNAMFVRFSSTIFSGAMFVLIYLVFRQLGIPELFSAWFASLAALLSSILLYTVTTYVVDPVTQKKSPTIKLRMSQFILVVFLHSSLSLLGVWVQEGFGIAQVANTSDAGRASLFLLITTITLYTSFSRSSRSLLARRFDGITNAALSLPWSDSNELALDQLKDFVAGTIPNAQIEMRSEYPGVGEIGAEVVIPDVGKRFLVLTRKPGGAPFSAVEQRVIEALAHMATATMRSNTMTTNLTIEANTDPLTGLANYRALQETVLQARDDGELNVAMVFIDMDDFKIINDTYGHHVGNEVLQAIAGRLRSAIRPHDLAARIGGDEFVVFLRRLHASANIDDIVHRMREKLSQPVRIRNGQLLEVGVSLGTSVPQGRVELTKLLSESDEHMYQDKRSRTDERNDNLMLLGEFSTFGTDLERIVLEAITEERLSVAYQPIVELESNRIVGVEALVRFRDDELGNIPAVIIVNIAQQLGVLDQLTEQVLERSFIEFTELREDLPEMNILHVNFEVDQILNEDIFSLILEYNSNHPDIILNIELNENSLNQASARTIDRLAAIRSDTIWIAMDDFGKSYSSLRALVHYPIDVVKIDKSLADDLLVEEDRSSYIIQALVELSDALNYKITVEGVEEVQQLEILKQIGTQYAQGFLFGKPLDVPTLRNRLQKFGDTGYIPDTEVKSPPADL